MNDSEQFNLQGLHLELEFSIKPQRPSSAPSQWWNFGAVCCKQILDWQTGALDVLIPFPRTYLCEAAMSALVNIETMYRIRLKSCKWHENLYQAILTLLLISLFQRDKNRGHT